MPRRRAGAALVIPRQPHLSRVVFSLLLADVIGDSYASASKSAAALSISLALLAACALAYLPVWQNDFVRYDDQVYITENAHVREGLNYQAVRWAVTATEAGNWHPLTWIAHLADTSLFGLDPRGHHGMGLALHAATAVALFLVLVGATGAVGPSALVAMLFAVHPLNVESVAWAAERKNTLSTLLGVLALGAYVAYARNGGWGRYLLVVFLLAAGLSAKPMLVTWPCLMLLLDYWPLRRWVGANEIGSRNDGYERAIRRRTALVLVAEKLPLFALSAAVSVITLRVQGVAQATLDVLPLGARIENALVAYAAYLIKAVWPLNLAVVYPHPRDTLTWPAVLAAAGLLALVSSLAIWQRRRRPYLIVGWLWYLGTLVPVIGLVHVGQQAMADRYAYVPLIGVFIMAAYAAAEWAARWQLKPAIAVASAVAVCLLLGTLAYRQVAVWRDTETLFRHALAVTDENAVAHLNVGLCAAELGNETDALQHLQEAARLAPGEPQPHLALAQVLIRLQRFDEAAVFVAMAHRLEPQSPHVLAARAELHEAQGKLEAARDNLLAAVALDESDARWHDRLARLLFRLGEGAQAVARWEHAVQLDPRSAELRIALADALVHEQRPQEAIAHYETAASERPDDAALYARLGQCHLAAGDLAAAEQHCRTALAMQPALAAAHRCLSLVLWVQGERVESVRHFQHTVRAAPDDVEARFDLANVLLDRGRAAEAIKEYREVLRRDGDHLGAANNLAWLLATSDDAALRDGAAAVELARRICQATDCQEPSYLSTLAAALAEAGDFDGAIETARRAIDAAQRAEQIALASKNEERIRLFEQGQPYRQRVLPQ